MIYLLIGVNIVLATLVIGLAITKLLRPRRAPARVRVPMALPSTTEES
jgi:hypothetical protein